MVDPEWVFICDTGMGGVVPGHRERMFMRSHLPYRPNQNPTVGVRWCSQAWKELGLGARGFAISVQGGMSRVLSNSRGTVWGGRVVVPRPADYEDLCALAADMLGPGHESGVELTEWSQAVVRLPGRSVYGVYVRAPYTEVPEGGAFGFPDAAAVITELVDAPLNVNIESGFSGDSINGFRYDPDTCLHRWPAFGSGTVDGTMAIGETEPVPKLLLDIAERYGNGRRDTVEPGAAVSVPTGSWRPLEPDENPDDHVVPVGGDS